MSGQMRGKVQTARQPRYQRLAESLIDEIRGGRLKVGATIPGEHELVAQHGLSRHTVREALRKLTELGLIERKQGVGTVVRARQPLQRYAYTVRTPAELLRYPAEARLHVQAVRRATVSRKLARELGVKAGEEWVCISALRSVDKLKLPICWVDIHLPQEYAAVAESIGRRPGLVYEMIEQRFGESVAAVEVDVVAELIPAALAEPLQVAAGSPSLRIVRRYLGAGRRPFEVSVSHHPAERYSFALELQRGWSAAAGWQAS